MRLENHLVDKPVHAQNTTELCYVMQSDILIGDLMLRMVCMHSRNKNPTLIVSISDNNLNISDEESITYPHFWVQAAGGAVYPLVLDALVFAQREKERAHS